MQTRKLFALIWQINAIIILLVGLIAVTVLSAIGYGLLKDATRPHQVENVASVALGDVQETTAELGSFEEVPGSTVLRAPLTVRQTYALGSGSKEAGSIRNYLYFEPTTRAAFWLRPSMDSIVLSSIALPSSEYGEKKLPPVVFIHVTIDRDTNGDKRLTESDKKQIAISNPNGKNYRILVPNADRLNEAVLLSSGQLLILYSLGTKLSAIELNPKDASSPITKYDVLTVFK